MVTDTDVNDQYACFLHICANLQAHNTCNSERNKRTYLIVIPDVSNGVVQLRSSVFYHHQQWINSTGQANSSCPNIKFYQSTDHRGTQVIVTYKPSSAVVSYALYQCTCDMYCWCEVTIVIYSNRVVMLWSGMEYRFMYLSECGMKLNQDLQV